MRAIVGAIVGGVIGLFAGIYFVSLVGIEPGNRVDLAVIAAVAVVFAAIGFVWGRR